MSKHINNLVIFLASTLCLATTPVLANSSLLGMLTSQLGITEQQASAGISALMNVAKQHLADTDYTKLLAGAPDLGTLAAKATPIATAPSKATDSMAGWVGYISTMLGYTSIGQMAQLTQTFAQYGLTADMVGKFLKIALDYVNSVGGDTLKGLLTKALQIQ